MRMATAHAELAAPIEQVWQTMTDLADYPRWNPFVVRVEAGPGAQPQGPVRLGDRLRLHVRWTDGGGGGAVADEVVTRLEPPQVQADGTVRAVFAYRYVSWLGRLGLVQAVREQVLTQAPGGPTVYTTREEFRGLLTPFLPLARVQAGFDAQAWALQASVPPARTATALTGSPEMASAAGDKK